MLATVLGIVIVLTLVLPAVVRPPEAQAFPGVDWAIAIWNHLKTKAHDAWKTARKNATDLAFKNALKVYLTKLAEDTAVYLSSFGTGQKPLFITDPKNYFKDLTDAAAGEYLDTIGTTAFGIDVCQPLDLRTQFSVESAVRALVDPANWCQNNCQNNQETALTSDTFLIGEGVVATPWATTLPQAEEFKSVMERVIEQSGCTQDELYDGATSYLTCNYLAVPASLGDNNPNECPSVVSSMGVCLSGFSTQVERYKQIVASDFQLCQNLCSARRRVARCTATQALNNLEQAGGQITHGQFIPSFTTYFEPGENDIGQILTLVERTRQIKEEAEKEDKAKRGDSDVLPVTDPVTGEVRTPRSLVEESSKKLAQDPSGSAFGIYTGSPLADAIGVFTNTLTKRWLERIYKCGLNLRSCLSGSGGSGGESSVQFVGGVPIGVASGQSAARALFASIAKPEIKSGGPYDVLSDLASCPTSNPGPQNCVITEKFRSAIEQQLTVGQALEEGLLEPESVFGFDANGFEPEYNQGYPYRSILILRKNRVVPVGWELAAQYIRDLGRGNFTLRQIVEAYDDCDVSGTVSPFCGFVDPDWVLKAPENFCRKQGFGEQVTSENWVDHDGQPSTPQLNQLSRQEQCVDDQTCLQENEDGSCKAYGYCVEEKPMWRFNGTVCEDVNNSCEAMTSASGASLALLTDTTNGESCTQENAGCRWYCQDKDITSGEFTCTDTSGAKSYFTSEVESCPEDASGCTEYIRTTRGSNLLANSSFETLDTGSQPDDGLADTLSGWTATGGIVQSLTGGHSGSLAVQFDAGSEELQAVFDTGYQPNGQSYTFSFFGRTNDTSCDTTFGIRSLASSALYDVTETATLSAGWQRFTATLTFDPLLTYDTTTLTVFLSPVGCRAMYDDVQLESGATFSVYKDYGSANKAYLNADRVSCTADEVGCDLYRSTTETVPGIATSADACSEAFVGCKAFYEVPVTENGTDPASSARTGMRCSLDQSISCATDAECLPDAGTCLPSVSLVPSTGTSCSAANVGCEEYTNLDVVAAGGEGREYYTFIRQCVKPPDEQKTYYTWVGSEQTGFQLTAYNLQAAPAGTLFGDDTVDGGPNYQPLTDDSLCTAAIYNDPTDTRWSPDCRQFFDASLNAYYRLYSRTVTVSEDCHPLRNTLDEQIYNAIPAESTTCPAEAAQCREYRGPAGYNIRTVLDDDFNDGDTLGWDGGTWSTESLQFGGGAMLVAGAVQTNATFAIPSELVEGKTYLLKFWAGATSDVTTTVGASFAGGAESFDGTATLRFDSGAGLPIWNSYTLGPLLLNREPTATDDLVISSTAPFVIDNVQLLEVVDSVYLVKNTATLCAGNENCDRYQNRDNETSYLKSFTRLCAEEKVGCEALIKTHNSDSAFEQSFDNGSATDGTTPKVVPADSVELVVNDPDNSCRSEFQGCTELGQPTLSADREVIAYRNVTVIDDPDTYDTTLCRSAEVGCDAWTNDRTGDASYFRDPQGRTCEYKTVTIAGAQVTDWFKDGTSGQSASDRCPVVYPPAEGQPEGNPASGEGWVGLCPAAQAGCTTYLDPAESTEANMLFNGGFENETDFHEWYLTSCGTVGCGSRDESIVTSPVHTGAKAAALTGTSAGYHAGIFLTIPSSSFEAGARYSLSVWLKTDDVANLKIVPAYVEWNEGGEFFSLNLGEFEPGDTDWTRFQLEFVTPANAVDITVYPVLLSEQGTVWIDDVLLTPATEYSYLEQSIDTTSCADVVSRPEGCMLFNNPSAGDLTYDADTTQDGQSPALCSANPQTCDSNTLLKVRPDRECATWLACQSSLEIEDEQTGRPEQACFDIGLCTQLGANGQCAAFQEESAENQAYTLPADVGQFQNLSGYSKVGASWADGTVEGYLPVSAMPQVGLGGQGMNDLVPSGSFDGILGVQCNPAAPIPGGWQARGEANVKFAEDADNPETACTDNLDENNVLLVDPLRAPSDLTDDDFDGVRVPLNGVLRRDTDYVVSFRIRYLDPPATSDQLEVVLGINNDGQHVQLAGSPFTPTNRWQRMIFGPLSLSSIPSFDPSQTVYLGILEWAGASGARFLIDDVSMKPVLETRTNPTLLGRDCRAYPTEDAPGCTYTDENAKNHQGWYGYCLDRDTQNQSQCLTWWPVDILAGENAVFGDVEDAGYSGRAPLYYCLEEDSLSDGAFQWPKALCIRQSEEEDDFYGCEAIAVVENPKPMYYTLVNSDWQFGSASLYIQFQGSGDWNPPGDSCWNDNDPGDSAFRTELGYYSCRADFNDCWDSLTQYYAKITLRVWTVSGSPNDCGHKNDGYGYNPFPPSQDEGPDYALNYSYPGYCKRLAQVIDSSGNGTPWSDRIEGGYSVSTPLSYDRNAECNPYGATPNISVPTDIQQCVRMTTWITERDPPSRTYGCLIQGTDCVDDPAVPQIATEENCAWDDRPLLLYHPYSPDNRNPDFVCDNLNAGNGFYACNGVCQVCEGGSTPGKQCARSSDCGGGGACTGQWNGESGRVQGVDRLKRLFASPIVVWETGNELQPYEPEDISSWDWHVPNNPCPTPPQRPDYPNDYCANPPNPSAINIGAFPNGQEHGNVYLGVGGNVNMYFNTNADPEQLPLLNILIDWGDGSPVDSIPWGGAPRTSSSQPHIVSHAYSRPDRYKPRIQLQDNWGWCTKGTSRGDCDGWVEYDEGGFGEIIVE